MTPKPKPPTKYAPGTEAKLDRMQSGLKVRSAQKKAQTKARAAGGGTIKPSTRGRKGGW